MATEEAPSPPNESAEDASRSPNMRSGDLVIIFESHDSLDHLYLSDEYGAMYNNRWHAPALAFLPCSRVESTSISCSGCDSMLLVDGQL